MEMKKSTVHSADNESASEPYFSKPEHEFHAEEDGEELRRSLTSLHLLSSGKFADVTVTCSGQSFQLHRLVLALFSPYFRHALESSSKTKTVTSLKFDGDPDLFRCCLNYMYKGTVRIPVNAAKDVADLADELGMQSLQRQCLKAFYGNTEENNANCFELWQAGAKFDDQSLADRGKKFALSKFTELQHRAEFLGLDLGLATDYLTHPDLVVGVQEERVMASVKWAKGQQDPVKQLVVLLRALSLASMGSWCFGHILHDQVFSSSKEIKSLIDDALSSQASKSKQDVGRDAAGLVSSSRFESCDGTPKEETPSLVFCDSSDQKLSALSLSLDKPCSTLTDLPDDVPDGGFAALCSDGETIYISGLGYSCRQVWKLDVLSRKWSRAGETKYARWGQSMEKCGQRVYIIGGTESVFQSPLVPHIECMDVTQPASWRTAGALTAFSCGNTNSLVVGRDIIIAGMLDSYAGNHRRIQIYSTLTESITHSVKVKAHQVNDTGIVLVGETIIMADYRHTYAFPLKDLYQNSVKLTQLTRFNVPSKPYLMGACDVTRKVFIVGKGKMFQASYDDIEAGHTGWQRLTRRLNIPNADLFSASATVISAKLL